MARRAVFFLILIVLSASCAFHPRGEREERELARDAYRRTTPEPLAAEAPLEAILQHGYLSNAELEARYWQWRAAIERIPQEASMPTVPAVSLESMFEEGATSLARTTLGVGNDPMTNIPWPGRVSTAGRRALENARAAGHRFAKAKLELRTSILGSYYEYALLAESIRLQESMVALLESASQNAEAQLRAGAGASLELLKAQNELDLAKNKLETLEAQVPGRLAMINALLGREPAAPLALPKALPAARELPYSDSQVLAFLAERNPELAALAHEAEANEAAVSLMRQQYIPEMGLTLSGDLEGMAKSIMVMLTAPFVRFDAIRASIAEAQAELEAARAMRRQTERDLKARAVLALYDLRNAERQAALFEQAIIPRTEEIVNTTSASYDAGRAPLTELLASEELLIEMKAMRAEVRMEREKLLAEIEELSAVTP